MSKSKKKQVARAREQAAAAPQVDLEDDDDQAPADPDATRPQEAAAAGGSAVDEALFERLVELVHALGEDREEGDQIAWVWNGPSMAIKYVEGEDELPRRMMVAAFKRGVVFQVEGDRQLVRRTDGWEADLPSA